MTGVSTDLTPLSVEGPRHRSTAPPRCDRGGVARVIHAISNNVNNGAAAPGLGTKESVYRGKLPTPAGHPRPREGPNSPKMSTFRL